MDAGSVETSPLPLLSYPLPSSPSPLPSRLLPSRLLPSLPAPPHPTPLLPLLQAGVLNFYSSPVGTDGFQRFSDAWTDRAPSGCANAAFNVTAYPAVFGTPPIDVAAFAYDCVVAFLAAVSLSGSGSAGPVMSALVNLSFAGASGPVRFTNGGERVPETLSFAMDNWFFDSSGSLSARRVLSFSLSSGVQRTSVPIVYPGGGTTTPYARGGSNDQSDLLSEDVVALLGLDHWFAWAAFSFPLCAFALAIAARFTMKVPWEHVSLITIHAIDFSTDVVFLIQV